MGAEPYLYFVPYQEDPQAALEALRQQEFTAGRYNPVVDFPMGVRSAPGAQHATIEEAIEDADADGTRSILDLEYVSDEPEFGAACRLDDQALQDVFGTTQPTHDMVEESDIFEEIDRGQGVCFPVYHNGKPHEWVFAGYSYD